jgi:hypothetical protein
VTHYHPVWPSDTVILADLSPYGMPGRFEQFWATRTANGSFRISCIPFFTYGIALGDTVECDRELTIQKIVKKDHHKTLRVALADKQDGKHLHEVLHKWADETNLSYEWYADGYLAVDLPPNSDAQLNMSLLDKLSDKGDISFEID